MFNTYARMIVYTTTLVNIACLIVIAWGMIGIDARLTLGQDLVSYRARITLPIHVIFWL